MLFYWAVLVYAAIVNLFGVRLLPNVNLAAGNLNFQLTHPENLH